MRTVIAGLVMCVIATPALAQTGQADPPVYLVEYSSAPMIRNAALADVGVRAIERGSEWVFDRWAGDLFTRKSTGGVFARIGQTAFNVVLEATGGTVAHEYGHASRVTEQGGSARVVITPFGGFFRGTIPRLSSAARLSIFGGGLEGSAVLAGRVGDRIHADGTATPGELTLLVLNAVGSESYILKSLSDSRLSNPTRLLTGGPRGFAGDPAQYVFDLAAVGLSRATPPDDDPILFAETQTTGRRVRSGSLINLIDYELAGAAVGLTRDFIWRGERQIPVSWMDLGPVSVSPGLRYMLSPNGPERQVRSRYKAGPGVGQGYVRWSDALTSASMRLVGAGGDYQHRAIHGLVPKLALDVWRNPDGHTSVRTELSTRFSRPPGARLVVSTALGGKGRGYLQGYPQASGLYFNLGAGFRF